MKTVPLAKPSRKKREGVACETNENTHGAGCGGMSFALLMHVLWCIVHTNQVIMSIHGMSFPSCQC